MNSDAKSVQAAVPSVDRVLNMAPVQSLIDSHGRQAVTRAARAVLADLRKSLSQEGESGLGAAKPPVLAGRIAALLEAAAQPTLRRVFNLTGTVLHTNLGRAQLPPEAIAAMAAAAGAASNLEFDLGTGRRGDRDSHLDDLLCRITGAEAATVVNNNAAAVLLVLNTLARRKEVPVSRGELIEIGGSFRLPDIMSRAGAKLVEVGTTNRTHAKDYTGVISTRTAMLMKVHTSNYVVQGFTKAVAEKDLAAIAHDNGLPLVVDLGSGTLVDLTAYGLPYEPTAQAALAVGADIVTFSGDKLLGGPQAGVIVGRADLIAKIKGNPMKRALRLDKATIAALAAVLRLYDDPDRLTERVPTLRHLARKPDDMREMAARLRCQLGIQLSGTAEVEIVDCQSQVGSGALPVERLDSVGLAIRPSGPKRGRGAALKRIAARFRALRVPVIGRVRDDALVLDLRCLDDEAAFAEQLGGLD